MPNGYTSHYPNGSNCDVTTVEKTWWYRLVYNYMQNAVLDMNLSFGSAKVYLRSYQGVRNPMDAKL